MRNHKGYLTTMKSFFIIELTCLILGLSIFFPLLLAFGIVMAIMGVFQLIEGVAYLSKLESRPRWFRQGLIIYWVAIAIYMLVAAVLAKQAGANSDGFFNWLWLAPWPIALYQFFLISKLRNYEAMKLEEGLWEAEQGQKNLNDSFSDY